MKSVAVTEVESGMRDVVTQPVGSEKEFLWRPPGLNVTEMMLEPFGSGGHVNTGNQYNMTEPQIPVTISDENYTSMDNGFTRRYSTSTFDFEESEVHANEYRIGLAVLTCTVVTIAITGNFLVLLAITKTRSLRRLNNFLLVSLAISDFLPAVTCMPLFITELFNNYTWILPHTLCSFYTSLQLSFLFLSTWNIAAISLERVFIIMYPMIYQRAVTERRMLMFIIVLWVISVAYGMSQLYWFNSEPYLSWSQDHPYFCRYVPSVEYAIIDFVVCFTLPLCVMFGAYLKIYCIVQSQMSRIHPRISEILEDGPSEFSTNNFENYVSQIYKKKQESQFSTPNPRDITTSDSAAECYRMRDENYGFVARALRKISFADVNPLTVNQMSQPGSESDIPTPRTEHDPIKSTAEASHQNDNSQKNSDQQINMYNLHRTSTKEDDLKINNSNVKQSIEQTGHHDSKEATSNYQGSDSDNNDNISSDNDKMLDVSCTTRAECETDYPLHDTDNQRSRDIMAQDVSENVEQIQNSHEIGDVRASGNDIKRSPQKNEVKLVVPADLTSNVQIQTDLNHDISCTEISSNTSFNRPIDPNQTDLNQSLYLAEVKCVEVETVQIHTQANKTGAVSPKLGADQSQQSINEVTKEVDHLQEIDQRSGTVLPGPITNSTDVNQKLRPSDKTEAQNDVEDDVFSSTGNVREIGIETNPLDKIRNRTNVPSIPVLEGAATARPTRPHSHEGQRLFPRLSRCFSDLKPPTTIINAGIEINISRASSKDGFAFPLRRASSAKPDLNSVTPVIRTSSTSSGFGTKLHPVLKTSSRNASTGNLLDHNGPTPCRKRNSVAFRLYDDEILPDDDPNTVQTIAKLRVSMGTEDTTNETSGTGTTEATLTPDNSITSNDSSSKRNLRKDPSKDHTHQWAKKHFNISREHSTTSTSVRSRGGSGASSRNTSSLTRRLRENKAIRMTAAVIGAFVLCILPYKIVFLMRVRDMFSVSDLGWNIVSSLMFCTNALNPFIYNFYNSTFRAAIKRLIVFKRTTVGPA